MIYSCNVATVWQMLEYVQKSHLETELQYFPSHLKSFVYIQQHQINVQLYSMQHGY